MNKEDFAFIGCRLLALFWVVKGLYSITTFASTWVAWKANLVELPSEVAGTIYFSLVEFILYLLIVFVLWFRADRLVHLLIPLEGVENKGGGISLFQAQSVVFGAVGVLILLTSFSEIGGVLFQLYLYNNLDRHFEAGFNIQAQLFELSMLTLLGLSLLFGSKGLSGLIIWFRDAGHNERKQ